MYNFIIFTTGPLPDLTKDQLTVLHTLMLCSGEYVGCIDDATIGNINVLKTINELQNKGFVAVTTTYRFLFGNRIQVLLRLHNGYCCSISFGQQYQLMRYYVTKYLYNDMEKDFFLSVASDRCLQLYANTHVHSSSEQNCPITLMRLIVEREVKGLQLEGIISHSTVVSHYHLKTTSLILLFSLMKCFGVYFTETFQKLIKNVLI